jgi:hypothetical protein
VWQSERVLYQFSNKPNETFCLLEVKMHNEFPEGGVMSASEGEFTLGRLFMLWAEKTSKGALG